MDRERAETFLRLLAQAEVRRVAAPPGDRAVVAEGIGRVLRVAGALTAVGVFGEEVTGPILDDFESALGTRGIRTLSQYRKDKDLRGLLRSVPFPPAPAAPDLAVPVGQVIPVRGEEVSGEVTLLSYARTALGATLIFVARPGQLRGRGWVMIPYRQFTATGDQGTSYQMRCTGGNRPNEWTVWLYPEPRRDLAWLDVSTTPGEPTAHIDLNPPGGLEVTVSSVTRGPAEQLLNNIAMRLLATGGVFPQFMEVWLAEMDLEWLGPLPDTADGLGDVVAALRVSGALPPRSPVPGQLAALCARLNVTGHGLPVAPDHDLPEPWLSVLISDTQAAPGCDGYAAVAAALPDLDGTRLSILGLTSFPDRTILNVHASGMRGHDYYRWPEANLAPAIWIRDSGGRWHATRTDRLLEGDVTMHLEVVPPLSHGTAWIEVLAAGQSAEVRATLPLRWR